MILLQKTLMNIVIKVYITIFFKKNTIKFIFAGFILTGLRTKIMTAKLTKKNLKKSFKKSKQKRNKSFPQYPQLVCES